MAGVKAAALCRFRRASPRKQHVWQASRRHRMITRLARKVSTFNATLYTAELLENILSNLDPQDLHAARQVCKAWASNIDASPLLQTRLYVRAEESHMTWVLDPLTEALRPYWFDNDSKVDRAWFERQGACVPAVLNTTFLSRDPACESGKVDLRQRFERAEGLKFNANIKSFYASPAAEYTFLTQPPAKEVIVYLAHRDRQPRKSWTPKPGQESRIQVVNESGVTWADLLREMQDGVCKKWRKSKRKTPCKLWIDIELSRVWIIGSVFYNEAEYSAVMSGREARKSGAHVRPLQAVATTQDQAVARDASSNKSGSGL